MWLSARWGGAFTPLLVALILQHISWRHTFGLFGLLGVVWAIFFYIWYRDNPRERKEINEAELAILPRQQDVVLGHGKIPWGKLLASKTVWLLWFQFACLNFGAVFYITWLPTYLREGRGMDITYGALLAGFPLFFGGLGSLFCGYISAPAAKWLGSTIFARRLLAGIGFFGAASCLSDFHSYPEPVAGYAGYGLCQFLQ